MSHYDTIMIGAGQGGGPLAGAFARAGRRTALIERAQVGGTCVNVGCTPTKTMVAIARMAYVAGRAGAYGVPARISPVDVRQVRDRKRAIVESFRTGSRGALDRASVEVIEGTGRFVGERTIEVRLDGDDRVVTADRVFISTGLRPAIPDIPGLREAGFLTSTSIMELDSLPDHLVVLGGGYVGLEFAQMFRRFGSRVTVLQRGPQLLAREDTDIARELAGVLTEDGIAVTLGARVEEVRRDNGAVSVHYRDGDEKQVTVSGSHVLVATGRVPNTDDLEAAAGGIALDQRGYVSVNERLETTARDVWAMGDVIGGPAFTHIAYDHFRILRANLLDGGSASTAGRPVPYAVFTDPQLGRIGLTEREARETGRRISVAKLPMSSVARAIELDETRGFMKAVVDTDTGDILGAAVLGIEGGEIATLFQIAMMGRLPYTDLRDGIFSHPTLAESLNNLFRTLEPA